MGIYSSTDLILTQNILILGFLSHSMNSFEYWKGFGTAVISCCGVMTIRHFYKNQKKLMDQVEVLKTGQDELLNTIENLNLDKSTDELKQLKDKIDTEDFDKKIKDTLDDDTKDNVNLEFLKLNEIDITFDDLPETKAKQQFKDFAILSE